MDKAKLFRNMGLFVLLMLSVVAMGTYTANYTTTDIDDIVADNLGEFGVQTKSYMSLLVLGMVALVIAGVVVKIKSA